MAKRNRKPKRPSTGEKFEKKKPVKYAAAETDATLRLIRSVRATVPPAKRVGSIKTVHARSVRGKSHYGNFSTMKTAARLKTKAGTKAKPPREITIKSRPASREKINLIKMEKRNLTARIFFVQARRKKIEIKNLGQVLAILGKSRQQARRILRQFFLEERTWHSQGELNHAVTTALQREFDPHRITKK